MAATQTSSRAAVLIQPSHGMRAVDLREVWRYRDLLILLIRRDIRVRYAQSVLGIGWAVIQPLAFMVVFSAIFGGLMNMDSDGAPYAIFIYAALVPWTFFSTALVSATGSLNQNYDMLTKVYFPRLVMPMSAVLGRLVDFGIALLLILGLMAWFTTPPTLWALTMPLLVALMVLTAFGLSMWLSAMAIHYRDIQYGMTFLTQVLMYAAPVVYPASLIPDQLRILYGLNPMVGVIEGFRSALLGTNPMPWDLLIPGSIVALVIAASGLFYFRRMERFFADVA